MVKNFDYYLVLIGSVKYKFINYRPALKFYDDEKTGKNKMIVGFRKRPQGNISEIITSKVYNSKGVVVDHS